MIPLINIKFPYVNAVNFDFQINHHVQMQLNIHEKKKKNTLFKY